VPIWFKAQKLLNGGVSRQDGQGPLAASRPAAFLAASRQAGFLTASRQAAFLTGSSAAGGMALTGLTLHLALAGPVAAPLLTVLGWMLLQGPLALYAVQTGRLEQAYGVSACSLALALTAVCLLTGGLASAALPGLALVPLIAALSGSRRVLVASGLAAGAGIGLLCALEPSSLARAPVLTSLAVVAAATAAGIVIFKTSQTAGAELTALKQRQSCLQQAAEGVVLHASHAGALVPVSGDVSALLGVNAPVTSGDWLFQMIHRDDRNGYLGALADCHRTGERHELEVRLDVAKTGPGFAESSGPRWVSVTILDAGGAQSLTPRTGRDRPVLIKLCDVSWKKHYQFARDGLLEQSKARMDGQASFLQAAAPELKAASDDIRALAGLMCALPRSADPVSAHQRTVAGQIASAGARLQHVVDGVQETLRAETDAGAHHTEALDLNQLLERAISQSAQLLEGAGLSLDVDKAGPLPSIAGDRAAVEQMLLHTFLMMADTCEPGTAVVLQTRREASTVILSLGPASEGQLSGGQPAGGALRRAREAGVFREAVITRLCAAQGGSSVIQRGPSAHVSVEITLPCPLVRALPESAAADTVAVKVDAAAGTADPAAGKQGLPLRKIA